MSSTVLFARINFDVKLYQFGIPTPELIKRRKNALTEVIDYKTNINSLLVKAKKPGLIKDVTWLFGGMKVTGTYIFGKIGKTKKYARTVRDDKTKDFVKELIDNSEVAEFLIDLKESVIVYESKKNVGEKAPIIVIQEIFNAHFGGKESISIKPITDKRKIIQRINKFKSIRKILLCLHPSNPDSTSSSDEMDNLLKSGRIDRFISDASSKRGIDLEKVPLIKSGLNLAEEGYGSAEVIGEVKDKKEETVTVGNIPLKSTIELTGETLEDIKTLIRAIASLFEKLKEEVT